MSEWRLISNIDVKFDPEYEGIEGLLWCSDFGCQRGQIWRRSNGEVAGSASCFHGVRWTHWQPIPEPPAAD